METWETVTVALLSSFVGGTGGALLATLLRIRHERYEGLRQRMVEAADDFATGVLQARMAFRPLRFAADVGTGERTAAFQEAARRVDVVEAREARVLLLFGEFTAAGNAAEEAMDGLWTAIDVLEDTTDSIKRAYLPKEPDELADDALEQVSEALREFNRAALEALRRPRFSQSRRRYERARERARHEAIAEVEAASRSREQGSRSGADDRSASQSQ